MSKIPRLNILRKLILVAGILVFLVIAILLVLQTTFAKNRMAGMLRQYALDKYGVRLDLESVDYRLSSPFHAGVHNIRIYGGQTNQETFASARSLEVDIPLSSFWSDDFIIQNLLLDAPSINPEKLPKLKKQEKGKDKGTFQIQKITLTGGGLQYLHYQLQEISMDAALETNAIRVNQLLARWDTLQLKASGGLQNFEKPEYLFNYEATGDAASVSRSFPEVPPLSGKITTRGKTSGGIDWYKVEGTLTSEALSVYKEPPFAADADYTVDSSQTKTPYRLTLRGHRKFAR